MEGRRASYAVGGDGLYYRAALNLFLEIDDMRFVPSLANVGFVCFVWRYWRLRRERYVLGLENRDCGAEGSVGEFIGSRDGGGLRRGWRYM